MPYSLLCTKAHLEEYCLGAEVALLTSKKMLQLWKNIYENKLTEYVCGHNFLLKKINF